MEAESSVGSTQFIFPYDSHFNVWLQCNSKLPSTNGPPSTLTTLFIHSFRSRGGGHKLNVQQVCITFLFSPERLHGRPCGWTLPDPVLSWFGIGFILQKYRKLNGSISCGNSNTILKCTLFMLIMCFVTYPQWLASSLLWHILGY